MTDFEYGLADGLADVEPQSGGAEYMRGYRRGAESLDQHERGVGPGWDD